MNFFWSYPVQSQLWDTVNYGLLYNWYAAAQPQSIEYGYLYNAFTVKDARNIANTGWHVPTYSDVSTLRTYASYNGGKLKETGFTYWESPNTDATNEFGFNSRGGGYRAFGIFLSFKSASPTWIDEVNGSGDQYYFDVSYNSNGFFISNTPSTSNRGYSIRLIKDSTTLSHGETGTYIGNDGRVYKTICIGTQEWLSENLMENKYRDGSSIPEVTDNTTWAGLTTGARCSYNNDETNAVVSTDIANTGWHMSTDDEFTTLSTYLGGDSVAGGKLKETGTTHWTSPNTGATNEVGFTALPSGQRYFGGVFYDLGSTIFLWTATEAFSGYVWGRNISYNSSSIGTGLINKYVGNSVRLVKDSTTLSDGETGTYTGNDGKVYRTICIGTQEWLADSLAETKYRDGSIIPEVTDNTEWGALTTGALCAYNNDWNNV